VTTANDPWGRVDADGTVYVRTADGERVIGSWQAGSPEEAVAFYQRKYEALETEVVLLEQRISATDMAPAQAAATVQRLIGGSERLIRAMSIADRSAHACSGGLLARAVMRSCRRTTRRLISLSSSQSRARSGDVQSCQSSAISNHRMLLLRLSGLRLSRYQAASSVEAIRSRGQ